MKSEERGLSRKHIIESVKASLLRLQLSYVDIVIIYKADPMCPMEGKPHTLHCESNWYSYCHYIDPFHSNEVYSKQCHFNGLCHSWCYCSHTLSSHVQLYIAFISYRGCSCNDVYNTRRLDNVLGHEQMVSNWGENYLLVANCRNFSFMCIQFNSFRLWKRIPIVVNSIVYRQLSNNRNIICFAVKSVNFTYRKCSIKLALE